MDKEHINIQVSMVPDYWKAQIEIPDVQREDTAWSLEQKQMLILIVFTIITIYQSSMCEKTKRTLIFGG